MEIKTYEIGDKKYEQRPLVLGQIRQLQEVIQGMRLDPAAGNIGLITALGDKMPQALAVVLIPEGVAPKDKDLAALAKDIEFTIFPEQIFEVVNDFFTCNPMQSLLERFKEIIGGIKTKIGAVTGSKSFSASSPEATSLDGKQSSGDILQENADHT
jgi:hypothetical protein